MKALLGEQVTAESKDRAMKLAQHVGAVTAELSQLASKDYAYTPAEARFGDRDKIVFWYKPRGTDTYRAIFGDLRVEEVTREQLPQE